VDAAAPGGYSYGEKGEQLDKAESYAKKATGCRYRANRKESRSIVEQQTTLQKGLRLVRWAKKSDLQKKRGQCQSCADFRLRGPLLKANDVSYARNQYRLGTRT